MKFPDDFLRIPISNSKKVSLSITPRIFAPCRKCGAKRVKPRRSEYVLAKKWYTLKPLSEHSSLETAHRLSRSLQHIREKSPTELFRRPLTQNLNVADTKRQCCGFTLLNRGPPARRWYARATRSPYWVKPPYSIQVECGIPQSRPAILTALYPDANLLKPPYPYCANARVWRACERTCERGTATVLMKIKKNTTRSRILSTLIFSSCACWFDRARVNGAASLSHPACVEPASVQRRLQKGRRPLSTLPASPHPNHFRVAGVVEVHVGVFRLDLAKQPSADQHFLRCGGMTEQVHVLGICRSRCGCSVAPRGRRGLRKRLNVSVQACMAHEAPERLPDKARIPASWRFFSS